MEARIVEAANYFKAEKGFERLFSLLIAKYRGIGRIGGSVTLLGLSLEEREAFSAFFRKDYSYKIEVRISFHAIEKALEKTRFSGIDLKQLLDAYHGATILSKVEEKDIFNVSKLDFFTSFIADYPHPNAQMWLQKLIAKDDGTRFVHLQFKHDPETTNMHMHVILRALSNLPQKNIRLPLFASQITGNPHAFDLDTELGRHLLAALRVIRRELGKETKEPGLTQTEETTELLLSYKLMRDDLQNFVTCTGLVAFRDGVEGVLPIWQAALEDMAVLNLPLREVIRIHRCYPAHFDHSDSSLNVVFLFENSGVYSAILDQFQSEYAAGLVPFIPPMICTHGQYRLATLLLLDHLVAGGTKLYYSGDFDPEGLHMAQNILRRYRQQIVAWRYNLNDYHQSISRHKFAHRLTLARLRRLNSIEIDELRLVKQEMVLKKVAGYQEELVDDLIDDMKRIMKML